MKVLITGGTGFIGKELCKLLLEQNYEVILISRQKSLITVNTDDRLKIIDWNQFDTVTNSLQDINCIINLAGESLNAKRWTERNKEIILKSRVDTTTKIIGAIKTGKVKSEMLINASAIGYYGDEKDNIITEASPNGDNFLSKVCRKWETEAFKAEEYGVKVVTLRTGIVLGKEGMLKQILLPFRLFVGGYFGNGKQWFSWIHIQDHVSIIKFILENKEIHGAVNLTAPNPVTMKEFTIALGKALSKPSWTILPEFMIKLIFGEKSILLLTSQRVIPEKIIKSGYIFRYSLISEALGNIIKGNYDD